MRSSLNIKEKRYDKLLVIQLACINPRKWLCLCDCGNKKEILQTHLIQGNIISCGCSKIGKGSSSWNGFGEIHGNTFYNIGKNIRNKKLPFTITKEYIWELFLKQERKCSYTGKELFFGKRTRDKKTASLDRIDSKKGYEIGNVQWIHKDINLMKNRYSENFFFKMCNLVSSFNGIKEDLGFSLETEIISTRLGFFRKNKKISINKKYCLDLYNKQFGRCILTGIPLLLNSPRSSSDLELNIASLDRIDNLKGYEINNVQWVHKAINIMRGKLKIEDFINNCKEINFHQKL